ncbi:MAG: dihydroorotate dehydrogenase electron transfer subunit [Candidatus Acetothermia bacterium]
MSIKDQRVREIEKVRRVTPTIKIFRVKDPPSARAHPGQFLMVWVPGSGEIPLAVCASFGDEFEMSVKLRGDTTEKLHGLVPGDVIGLRGPFGNGFTLEAENPMLVGGGYGIAPLRHLYRTIPDQDGVSVVAGAATADELLFLDEMEPDRLATDDGSKGRKGTVIPPMKELLDESEIDRVYATGPEKMIYRIAEICREQELKLEASLERIMKCGVGLCGSCLIDGFRVCQDGPVANLDDLAGLKEFGNWERSFSGKKRRL